MTGVITFDIIVPIAGQASSGVLTIGGIALLLS